MSEAILEILRSIREDADFESSEDFIEDGFLDSFEIVNLVSELEERFQIEIRGTDIVPENFINLNVIAALVEKYQPVQCPDAGRADAERE